MQRSLIQRLAQLPRGQFQNLATRNTLKPSFLAFYSTGNIQERIASLVKESDVVIFMKGVPEQPRCGFSNAVVQILQMHDVPFKSHDVLQDEDIRQGVKEFSNWPTIPQVYFKGEFIGGCDILLNMHQSGEIIEELEKIGIKSALDSDDEKK